MSAPRQDGASAAGPRECWGLYDERGPLMWAEHPGDAAGPGQRWICLREVVQESQPSTAPAAQGEDSEELATCLGCGKVGVMLKSYRAPGPDAEADDECAECGSGDVYDTLEEAFAALYANWPQPPAASQGMREAVEGLEAVRSLLDERCGDTDITHLDEEELKEAAPEQWMCQKVSEALAALSRSQEAPAKEGGA